MRKFALIDRHTGSTTTRTYSEEFVKDSYHSSLAQRYELFELVPRTIETKTVTTKEIV